MSTSIHDKLTPKQPSSEKVMFQGRVDKKLKAACLKELERCEVTISAFLEAAIKSYLDEKSKPHK